MIKRIVFSLSLFASSALQAGTIADTFSEEVFGVPWGATLADVKKIFPDGEVKTYGNIKHYVIENSKPILKIERDDNEVIFAFNTEGRFHSVGVDFDGSSYGDVLLAANTYFGKHTGVPNSQVVRVDWPEDKGIRLYLINMPSGFSSSPLLTIENTNSVTNTSKEDLGF